MNNTQEKNLRKTGIDVIDQASFGTHLCLFYQNKEDLLDILVPYFKAGLENNEFCMWVTAEPLSIEEAKDALNKVVGNLNEYINKAQIEILDSTQWYTKSGIFHADEVLNKWAKKEEDALRRGFGGIRITGNVTHLAQTNWEQFVKYEEIVNSVINNHKIIAICGYFVDGLMISQILDTGICHQSALIRQKEKWNIIESSKYKAVKDGISTSL